MAELIGGPDDRATLDSLFALDTRLDTAVGRPATIQGRVLRVRRLSWGAFVVVELPRTCVQCVIEKGVEGGPDQIREGDTLRLHGIVAAAEIKDSTIWPRNAELKVSRFETLSKVNEPLPVDISKKELFNIGLDAVLDTRPISLRHPRERAKFKMAEAIGRGFRDALLRRGFTELHTPKIVSEGAEGGANIFRIDYFGRPAYLAQSPQFYKQMGVGIFGRVFEVGPVFRAEKHATSRHLNEYTSLDLEMGPIGSMKDVMNCQMEVLREIFQLLTREYAEEIEITGALLPVVPERFPVVTVEEVHEIAGRRLRKDLAGEPDLDPSEEREIHAWAKEEYDSDFVFVTAFPTIKRPFYAMDDLLNPSVTLSFDLIFRGQEITTGGQRIHEYDVQVEKMKRFGLNPDRFSDYLMIHRYGMPPHGGLGMGLERLLGRILDLDNIREATMFPRDLNRLSP